MLDQIAFVLLALLPGLVVGSFLNMLIHRLPLMLHEQSPFEHFNLAWPRSHCPHCLQSLRPWQLIPLVGFLLLKGRCAACRQPISWRYPLVEGLCALSFAWFALHYQDWETLLAACSLTALLIALATIDVETGLLPDSLNFILLWLGLLVNLHGRYVALDEAVLGVVAGYGILWLLFWVYRALTGKEGLGYGDFKLLAALGAWVGWQGLPQVLLLASLTGLLVAGMLMLLGRISRRDILPFGPFLALAGWVVWVWGGVL